MPPDVRIFDAPPLRVAAALARFPRSEVRFRGQSGKHLLTSRLTGFDPKRSSH